MNSQIEQKLKQLPLSPGVYFHKSSSGEIIYVGKAAVLRNRVKSYFQESRARDSKTQALVNEIADVDWVEVDSEVDALFLESEMVKRYLPRYNILLRDDKSQSFVRIDSKSQWPKVTITRNPADDGAEYFGPFYNGFALKKALRFLRKAFPYLTDKDFAGKSALHQDIGLSPRLSDGPEAYQANLRQLIGYIKGQRKAIISELESEMKAYAKQHNFERAAVIRNQLQALRQLQNRVSFGDREFIDISKDRALTQLSEILGLSTALRRIEGYDVSHISGQAVVASMVVFLNGTSSRADYRKFKLRDQLNDDPRSMFEVIARRFSQRNLKSWGLPDLVLVDGGKAQLAAASQAMSDSRVALPLVAVAKKQDELIVDRDSGAISTQSFADQYPQLCRVDGQYLVIKLHDGRKSQGHSRNLIFGDQPVSPFDDLIRLVQRIRDEAHRFAISYHSTVKRSQMKISLLEQVDGIGPKTRTKLIRRFGGLNSIRSASLAELTDTIGASRAKTLAEYLESNTAGTSTPNDK